jgi:hypothetical protein
MAVFLEPVVLEFNAEYPNAELNSPVVVLLSA